MGVQLGDVERGWAVCVRDDRSQTGYVDSVDGQVVEVLWELPGHPKVSRENARDLLVMRPWRPGEPEPAPTVSDLS